MLEKVGKDKHGNGYSKASWILEQIMCYTGTGQQDKLCKAPHR